MKRIGLVIERFNRELGTIEDSGKVLSRDGVNGTVLLAAQPMTFFAGSDRERSDPRYFSVDNSCFMINRVSPSDLTFSPALMGKHRWFSSAAAALSGKILPISAPFRLNRASS